MLRVVIVILSMCISLSVFGQRFTISGVISDAQTGETLVGASVLLKDKELKGTTSNGNGFFTLAGILATKAEFVVSFVGYESQLSSVDFTDNNKVFIEIKLHPSKVLLSEINVVEEGLDKLGDREIEISRHSLTPKVIQSIPTARNDVFKAIRYLPGIEPTEPMSPLVSVRGSDPGENLIMLDGVTIYNPYHFISSSGIFNMQTIKNVELLIGGFGAEYGGRNSSVMNISTKDGDNSALHGEIQPTTSESKIFMEFPIGKKSTMMVAGRLNYDIMGNVMLDSRNYFYDMNLSYTYRLNPRNTFSFKYFGSGDRTKLSFNTLYRYLGNSIGMSDLFNDMNIEWRNRWDNYIVTGIWKSVLAPDFFMRAQVYGSLHNADNFSALDFNIEGMGFNSSTQFKSKVRDWSAKLSFDYKPLYWNELNFGAEFSTYYFYNGSAVNNVDAGSSDRSPYLAVVYVEDKLKLGTMQFRPGVRVTYYNNQDLSIEPRLNLTINLPKNVKVQAAWGKYAQYIVSMNTQEFEFNQLLDYYYPLINREPGLSYHYIIGAEKKIMNDQTFSVDLYYKDIARTYTFDLLQSQYETFALSEKVIEGRGRSYGVELLWKGSYKLFSGWLGYTYSRSTRSFPHILNGQEYNYDYERRHSIKAAINFQATPRIAYSASFIAQSGVPRSMETTYQTHYIYDPLTGEMLHSLQYVNGLKNNVRMPWLFYLDLGLQKRLVSGFGRDIAEFFGANESYLTVNVYNVLFFRRNILYYYPMGFDLFFPVSDNYLPVVSAGYTIKF